MRTLEQPQSKYYADSVQLTSPPDTQIFRLDFILGNGDVLLCLSSGFDPAPTIDILARLDERQENTLLRERQLDLTIGDRKLQIQLHPRALLAAKPQSYIDLSVPHALTLPLRVQLWSYDPKQNCAGPNLPQNTVCMKARLSYSSSHCFLTGKTKVYVSHIDLQGFPDGFLCYRVGDYEYPIPNALLPGPIKLNQSEVKLQATSPWQDCIDVRRD